MSDSKTQYSAGVAGQRALAQLDAELRVKLDRASSRAERFHSNWQAVNLNDFVDRFAPGSKAEISGSKIIFHAEGSNIQVVCDVRGGYCRLQDLGKSGKRVYLDINGHDANNKTTSDGKRTGRNQSEYNEATHFRILKRKEM